MLFPKKKLNGWISQLIVLFLEQNKLSMGDMIMQHCSYELLLQANGKRQFRGYNDIEGKALSHQRLIEMSYERNTTSLFDQSVLSAKMSTLSRALCLTWAAFPTRRM